MIAPTDIEARIVNALPNAQVQVFDLTGGGDHYRVIVVAAEFVGQSPVDRHRMVYAPFKDVLGGELHALSLETRTPGEWEQEKKGRQGDPGTLPRL